MASVLAAGLTACSVDEHRVASDREEPQVPELSADVVEGQLLVRFDARVSDVLDKAGLTKSGLSEEMKRSGVLSVDEILDLVEGYRIERVFPVDERSEAKAREEGLHLWWILPPRMVISRSTTELSGSVCWMEGYSLRDRSSGTGLRSM